MRPHTVHQRRRLACPLPLAALVVCLPLVVAACAGLPGANATYDSARASRGNLSLTTAMSGTVRASVYAVNVAGAATVSEIDVAVGQQVTRGQVLARLDATALQDALTAAHVTTSAAATAADDAANALGVAQSATATELQAARATETDTLQNQCPHAANGQVCVAHAEATYNAAVAQTQQQLALAQSQLSIARAQLAAAQSAEQNAKSALSQATITAPVGGTVAAINGAVGAPVGTATGTGSVGDGSAFIQIVDFSQPQIAASASQTQLSAVRAGDAVRFSIAAYPDRTFRGTVGAISPLGQGGPDGQVLYPVAVNVDMQSLAGASLLPGVAAHLVVTTAQRYGVLLVPNAAVSFARQAADPKYGMLTQAQINTALEDARRQLATLQLAAIDLPLDQPAPSFLLERQHERWVIKPVVLGLTNGSAYEVLAGLADGEQVVTGPAGNSVPLI